MKVWRTESEKTVMRDLVSSTKEFLAKHAHNDVRIFVGCDSQNLKKSKWTGYVTTVVFHIGTNDNDEFYGHGGWVLFKSEKIVKIHDNWTRLWKEVEKSMEVAEELRKAGILIYRVDLDFNEDDTYDSNRLVSAGEGLFKGLGYRVGSKPEDKQNSNDADQMIATRAADHLIKVVNWKKVPLMK